ncbi:hypothetical protein L596_018821 [Steinernema carpocapsae]|uniref:Enhancer of polycomb-like protein n=1 Tax=Steinernema carpocapsae TaxID=34508 RepID=A0A4U5N6L3_STECR|nr:hypothetical protein L596_018821 [Steinernema carpocapsae]
MESHLQEAILARQHHTAGIAVENHVIPTPQVGASSTPWYQKTYPSREKPGNLIRLQGVFGFDEELPEYDLDSHDEEWLAKKPYIDPTEFEQIVQILEEHSSETEICQPSAAKSLLSKFDEVNANDVYDYWLQKRKINAENNRCPLILHLRTEPRISSTGNNHYIAFRKRAEKMQTRKNRKNDEETFEKILKLRHDMRKATTLFDMIRQRERTKFALLDVHEKTFAAKLELEELALQSAQESPKNAESVKVKSPRKRRKRLTIKSEYDPVTKSCLKKNDDAWNDIYSMSFDPTPAVPSTSTSDNSKAADITTNSELDGKYEFTRRKGCVYRSPLTLTRTGDGSLPEYCAPSRNQRFYETTVNGRKQFARVRVGRGGRRMLDVCENDSLNAPSVFGFSDPIFVDTSRSYRARTPRSDEEDGPSFVSEEGEEVARDEDSSEVEMSTYLDDSSLRRWVQKEPECFITVGTERRVPVVPVKSPESEKDFFQKPPTTTSRESAAVEEPMDYEHESSEVGRGTKPARLIAKLLLECRDPTFVSSAGTPARSKSRVASSGADDVGESETCPDFVPN